MSGDLSRDLRTLGKRQPISVRFGVDELAAVREAAEVSNTPITRWMREAILQRLDQVNGSTARQAV